MICFICIKNVSTFSTLAFHYKCMHFLGPLNTYECSEANCSQTFQNLNSLRKHVVRVHNIKSVKEINKNTEVLDPILIMTFVTPLINADNVNILVNSENTSLNTRNNSFNLKEALKSLICQLLNLFFYIITTVFLKNNILDNQSKITDKILNSKALFKIISRTLY